MGPFEKPVNLVTFPDYGQHVPTPMDLQTIERKVKAGAYLSPEDFEYDVLLIFSNCVTYNAARKTDHLVAMGKHGIKQFKRLFASKMRSFDDPSGGSVSGGSPKESSSSTTKDPQRKAPPEGAASQGPGKKLKLDMPSAGGISRGKTAQRSSSIPGPSPLTISAPSTDQVVPGGARPRTPKPITPSLPKPKVTASGGNQPVPLHIAIAQVKENFPLRRAVKDLQSWEASCTRFFKELMRHSWISAARPKFIFHVPVPVLFPVRHRLLGGKLVGVM